jgi:hypothetical protein
MRSFSKRFGFAPTMKVQDKSMDKNLRVALWNCVHAAFWEHTTRDTLGNIVPVQNLQNVLSKLWVDFLRWPIASLPYTWSDQYGMLSKYYSTAEWYAVYDFVEFMAPFADKFHSDGTRLFSESCNRVLEEELSAYRFIGTTLSPMTSPIEIEEIVIAQTTPYREINEQIHRASEAFSKRPNGDYRTCVKESLGAMETAARIALNDSKGTLHTLLPVLQKRLGLHAALVDGLDKIYGWSGDQHRHGQKGADDFSEVDAHYWLVSCSAFINYLLRLSQKARVIK